MSDFSTLRRPLSDRLPIVTYANRWAPVAESVWVSPQVERLTGYPAELWTDRPGFIETVLHPDDREPMLEEMRASREEGRAFSHDYRLVGPDGRVVWIHDESVPIVDEQGEPELIQGFFVDITERKELEHRLGHVQKLEALGRLAGGIAHDFNNFLAAIGGYAELALRALPANAAPRRHLQELMKSVESATRLTRQLLSFSRGHDPEPELVDLAALVDGLRPLLRRVAGDWVRLALDVAPTPQVYADIGQLEQLLVNLVGNARDAHAGEITIRTGTAQRQDRVCAYLTVTDDGEGMDEDTRKHAFEPFFTTRDSDRGTGLGLWIVDDVVARAGGKIELESATGAGTKVAIHLPSAPLG